VPKVAPDLEARLDQMQDTITLRLADAIRVLRAAPLCGYEPSAAVRALCRLKTALERPCRILIVGETCTGKTSLANLLIGSAVLPTHKLPNTRITTLIAYFERLKIEAVPPDGRRRRLEITTERTAAAYQRLLVGLPLPFLKKFEVLDTPGLDAQRSIASEQYLREHSADIVLWCTSSFQPWSASERTFWSRQPSRLKSRSLLVITHGDLLTPASDREQLVRRLRQEIGAEFRDVLVLCTRQPPAEGFDSSDVEGRSMSDWLEALAFEARAQRVEAARRSAARISQRVLARVG
jgi:GTPase SAR1 family protein